MSTKTPDNVRELNATDVRWTCDPSRLTFITTADLAPPDALIGQTRAERSLEFGVDIRSPGFNIYASGIPGTGRTSMIVERLREEASERPIPDDWCYVYNFDDSHRPLALRLPAGTAPAFSAQMADVVETLVQEIPRAFETDEYRDRRDHITQSVQNDRRNAFHELEQRASAVGFGLIQSPTGLKVTPVADGKPMSPDTLNALSAAKREHLQTTSDELEDEVTRAMRWVRTQEREARGSITTLDRDIARASLLYGLALTLGHGRYFVLPLTAGILAAATPARWPWVPAAFVMEFFVPLPRDFRWILRTLAIAALFVWPGTHSLRLRLTRDREVAER